jgi:hypothetical protein
VTEPMTNEATPAELLRDLSRYMATKIGHGMTEKTDRFAERAISFFASRTPLNATPIVTGSELLTREEAESVYNALRHPLGITQFTGHSITLIREAVNIVLSARIPLYTQPQSQRIAELEAALKPFLFGDPAMEEILWGNLPDDKLGTFSMKLGDLRAARRALSPPQDKGGV